MVESTSSACSEEDCVALHPTETELARNSTCKGGKFCFVSYDFRSMTTSSELIAASCKREQELNRGVYAAQVQMCPQERGKSKWPFGKKKKSSNHFKRQQAKTESAPLTTKQFALHSLAQHIPRHVAKNAHLPFVDAISAMR